MSAPSIIANVTFWGNVSSLVLLVMFRLLNQRTPPVWFGAKRRNHHRLVWTWIMAD
jgi:hypothetical protein